MNLFDLNVGIFHDLDFVFQLIECLFKRDIFKLIFLHAMLRMIIKIRTSPFFYKILTAYI